VTDARVRGAKHNAVSSAELLERGRNCFTRNEWDDAFRALSAVDAETPLAVEDLDRLALSAGLTARDEQMLSTLERVYNIRLEAGEGLTAARAAFWLGFRLFARSEPGRASGWLGRAQRLVEREGRECVEQGYLLLPVGQRHLNTGEFVEAHDAAARAAEFGDRFSEVDLSAFARNLQGRALLASGQLERGLALMDEAMVAATSGELSPVVTGIIYCSAIASCQKVYALDRAREWTVALTAWCETQPQLGMFTAYCHVHRAEVMQLIGYWPDSVAEARRAVALCVRDVERDAAGRAHYQRGEIHRLRGEFAEAEAAYRDASRSGIEPQPGLALLRLVQGDKNASATSIRRIVAATSGRLPRTQFLPAYVEILLAVGDLQEANAASRELEQTALDCRLEVLVAIASHAVAAVRLAEGNPAASLDPARRAFVIWQGVGAPYLAARMRVLLAQACIALGDVEASRLELDAARETFQRLGARPDLLALDAIQEAIVPDRKGIARRGLTERELQVLRLLASGKTNKVIARELSLSEKTVDRHVSNIFDKLNVSSRAAATAFAYEHDLI
jgi:DNA-binding CsgD family transcriptional regulator